MPTTCVGDLLEPSQAHDRQMGLGKTVQMISLILAHRAESKPRTTLVVVPLALVEQWRLEIEEKTRDDALSVIVHHGPKRTKDASDETQLRFTDTSQTRRFCAAPT